jgi:hypothetical protein
MGCASSSSVLPSHGTASTQAREVAPQLADGVDGGVGGGASAPDFEAAGVYAQFASADVRRMLKTLMRDALPRLQRPRSAGALRPPSVASLRRRSSAAPQEWHAGDGDRSKQSERVDGRDGEGAKGGGDAERAADAARDTSKVDENSGFNRARMEAEALSAQEALRRPRLLKMMARFLFSQSSTPSETQGVTASGCLVSLCVCCARMCDICLRLWWLTFLLSLRV